MKDNDGANISLCLNDTSTCWRYCIVVVWPTVRWRCVLCSHEERVFCSHEERVLCSHEEHALDVYKRHSIEPNFSACMIFIDGTQLVNWSVHQWLSGCIASSDIILIVLSLVCVLSKQHQVYVWSFRELHLVNLSHRMCDINKCIFNIHI